MIILREIQTNGKLLVRPNMGRITLIIAGNFSEFLHYVRASNLDSLNCIYVYQIEQLRKYRDVNVLFIGQYWLNPVWKQAQMTKEVLEAVPSHKRLTRAVLAKPRAILKRILQIWCQKT